jgi:GT2 family glycosyltransferase
MLPTGSAAGLAGGRAAELRYVPRSRPARSILLAAPVAGQVFHREFPLSGVYLLLATYNGGRYLPEFLDSLRRQSHRDWRLLARDDGSTDATPGVLREAAGDARITVLDDRRGRLGLTGNFEALVGEALRRGAQSLFLADQDDVWRENKIALQLAALSVLERERGSATPLLVHTDLAVVDEQLRPVAPSYTGFADLVHDVPRALESLLVRNHVTGCALAMNRAAAELALPVPAEAVVHDWWFGLCAAAAGECRYLPESAVLYRQHHANTIGASRLWSKLLPWRRGWGERWRRLHVSVGQARCLAARLRERGLEPSASSKLRLVDDYCRLYTSPRRPWRRWREAHRLGVVPRSPFWAASLAARLALIDCQDAEHSASVPGRAAA